jgi:hypothetical protein
MIPLSALSASSALSALVVYSGLLLILAGVFAVIHPIRRLRLTTRERGGLTIAVGVVLVLVAWWLPVREMNAMGRTRLDQILPRYQFSEHHERHIDATPAQVWRALHEVKASDIRLFRTLTSIRRLGRAGPESILNAPERLPILDVALKTSFVRLASEPGRELVIGTTVIAPQGAAVPRAPDEFRSLTDSGFAVAAMNFRIHPHPRGGSLVTTDTRVFATDPVTRRRFARYWSVIYPGSALIRWAWLRAIAKGAEGAEGADAKAGRQLHSRPARAPQRPQRP